MRSRLELGRSPGSEVGALAELLASRWGVNGELTEIGSFEDRNFLVETSAELFVVRLSKTSPERDFELEHAAMRWLAEPGFPYGVPAVVPPGNTDNHADGEATVGFDGHLAPLLTWVPGKPLSEAYELDESTLAAIGHVTLLPDGLDTIFLVNSGREACDLAIQLARVYTGRRDLLVLAGAYHGWTEAVYELCTSPADNPGWRETIPNWVHVAPQPDPYRGALGGEAEPYVAALERALDDAEGHGGPAAFICEPLLGNQGAVEPPVGYLEAAYAAVRGHGGLCIADEIQVGYGRPGFWAFEHEGVVPDIVIAAKAAGNGHPIGIVAWRRGIADAIDHRAPFSSTGGVTCEIGLAVLDVLRDEGLPENAATIGAHLKAGLGRLAVEHSVVGAVHGRGLYLGIDLVRDRTTREPWAELAEVVCERMRQRGVIIQPTGDVGNVLKVKPPLCITEVDAEITSFWRWSKY